MERITIFNRNDRIIYSVEASSIGEAVERAVADGVDFSHAYLYGADLRGRNLAGGVFRCADLDTACLRDANLSNANFELADLVCADAAGANLNGANFNNAKLTWANIGCIDYSLRAEQFRKLYPSVPVIKNICEKILNILHTNAGKLDMSRWHTCETTHCLAGWAIHLAGDAGYALQAQVGAEEAGRRIFLASTGRAPYFFSTEEQALADLLH